MPRPKRSKSNDQVLFPDPGRPVVGARRVRDVEPSRPDGRLATQPELNSTDQSHDQVLRHHRRLRRVCSHRHGRDEPSRTDRRVAPRDRSTKRGLVEKGAEDAPPPRPSPIWNSHIAAERIGHAAVSRRKRMERLMLLDLITPILALVPYLVILAALAAIPIETLPLD